MRGDSVDKLVDVKEVGGLHIEIHVDRGSHDIRVTCPPPVTAAPPGKINGSLTVHEAIFVCNHTTWYSSVLNPKLTSTTKAPCTSVTATRLLLESYRRKWYYGGREQNAVNKTMEKG
jgi:hypothetical protein